MNWLLLAGLITTLFLTLLNLSLTAALIRHVRDHKPEGDGHHPTLSMGVIGQRVGAFQAPAIGGGTLSERDLAGVDSLVAFVSTGCPPCEEVVDGLADRTPMPERRLIVFVLGDDGDAVAVAARLPRASVSRTELNGRVAEAFGGVDGYPRLLLVSDSVVTAAGFTLDHVVRAGAVPAHSGAHA